jgi:hypothetical protein
MQMAPAGKRWAAARRPVKCRKKSMHLKVDIDLAKKLRLAKRLAVAAGD